MPYNPHLHNLLNLKEANIANPYNTSIERFKTTPLNKNLSLNKNMSLDDLHRNFIKQEIDKFMKSDNKDNDTLLWLYGIILGYLIYQNSTMQKKAFSDYIKRDYKVSNTNIAPYEIKRLESMLKPFFKHRLEYSNHLIKQLAKKDYKNSKALLIDNINIKSRDSIKGLDETIKALQTQSENVIDNSIHRMRGDLNKEVAKHYNALGYLWFNQQDNRVVGNPMGLYPIVVNPYAHGNHWDREGVLYLYDFINKHDLKELRQRNVKFKWDRDLKDGSPGEPYGCRCYRVNIYNVDDIV